MSLTLSAHGGIGCDLHSYFQNYHYFDASAYPPSEPNQILWVKAISVAKFCREILVTRKYPFVLIVNDGDNSFPSECR